MITGEESANPSGDHGSTEPFRGLTIRQRFAMAAMQGLCAGHWSNDNKNIAQKSVSIADALILELNKKVLTEDKGK